MASDWKFASTTPAYLMETTPDYLEQGRVNGLKFTSDCPVFVFSFFLFSSSL